MATSRTYKELTDLVTCEICHEEFLEKIPRMLPCLHVFCEPCIQSFLETAKTKSSDHPGTVQCPLCSQPTKLSHGCASDLPLFFHCRKIEDARKHLKQHHMKCQLCEADNQAADVGCYCIQCGTPMCAACQVKHDTLYTDHSNIKVSPSTVTKLICSHHDIHMEHFCVTCSRAICFKCHINAHHDHNVYDLTYEGIRPAVNVRDYLLSELNRSKKSISSLNILQENVKTNIKMTQEELKNQRDELVKMIDNKYKDLCLVVEKEQDMIVEEITERKQLAEKAENCINKLTEATEAWNEPVDGVSEASIKNVEKLLDEVKKQIPVFDVNITRTKTLKFVPYTTAIKFGEITHEGQSRPEETEVSGRKLNPIYSVHYPAVFK